MKIIRLLSSTFALITCIVLLNISAADTSPTSISAPKLQELLKSESNDMLLLDVRSPREYAQGHISTALNIPHTVLGKNIYKIDNYKNKPVIIYCRSGVRAGIASQILSDAGFSKLLHLSGDMNGWHAAGFPVQK
ncbi:rhodanese-like domain-containing protein [Pseudomonadota bacterium]